jgi:lysyl-tRNA synthetase class 2
MEDPQSSDLLGQRKVRLEKLEELKKLGINPYPAESFREQEVGNILESFEEFEEKETVLAGRVTAWREHGKLVFGNIKDATGEIQLMIRESELKEDLEKGYLGWEKLWLLDLADFVELYGTIGKTRTGEITIMVEHIRLLTKALRPIPRKLEDKEQIFRRRYLDLVVNQEHFEMFKRKAKFWQVQRDFLRENGFMEVEVPILEPVTGGADATPFTTHHNALDQDFYLRISTELYQKRLIGAGYEKVYTFGPHFRNEGMDDEHLQEFYDVEWYWAYADFRDNMELVRELFLRIANEIYGKTEFTTRGHTFDLADDWEEIDYTQAIKDRYDVDIFEDDIEDIRKVVESEH